MLLFKYVTEQMTPLTLAATAVTLFWLLGPLLQKRMERAGPRGRAHTLALHPATFPGAFTRPPLGSVKELTQTVCLPLAKPQGAMSAQSSQSEP